MNSAVLMKNNIMLGHAVGKKTHNIYFVPRRKIVIKSVVAQLGVTNCSVEEAWRELNTVANNQ